MEIIDYLLARKKAGGGSDVTIEQLSVTENGTYSEEGIAYSPVVVNVPAPENSYQLKDLPTGAVSTIEDGTDLPMSSLKVGIEPVQDLHGYDHPWAGGAGKNLFDKTQTFITDKYIDANGDVQSTTYGWEISDYIPLKNNTNYYISGNNVTGASAYDALYDSDKNLVRTLGYSTSAHNGTFTTDENEFYIRICTQKSVVNNVQLEEGSTATSYEPYSNICPISGWTAANVTRTGKNLFDKSGENSILNGYINSMGVFYTASSEKCVVILLNAGTYTVSKMITTRFIVATFDSLPTNGETGNVLSSNPNFTKYTFTITEDKWLVCFIYNNTGETATIEAVLDTVQVELGNAATTYEPYNGTTYTIQFTDGDNPLTVYGGTLDVTTGELVVDRASVDLGDYSWTGSNNRFNTTTTLSNAKAGTHADCICSQYKPDIGASTRTSDFSICFANNGYCYIYDTSFTGDATDFKSAMNGVQLVYELVTPVTYHLTPVQVRTLVGNNNIWADTGDVLSGKYFKEL